MAIFELKCHIPVLHLQRTFSSVIKKYGQALGGYCRQHLGAKTDFHAMYSIKMVQSIDFTVFEYENVICIARIQRKRRKNNHFFCSFLLIRSLARLRVQYGVFFHSPEGFPHDESSNLSCIQMSNFASGVYTRSKRMVRDQRERGRARERSCTSKEKPVIISKVFPAISAASQLIICFPFSLFLSRSLSCTSFASALISRSS